MRKWLEGLAALLAIVATSVVAESLAPADGSPSLALLGAIVAGARALGAGKLVKKAAGWAGRQVLGAGRAMGAKTVGGAILRTGGAAVASAGAGALVTRAASSFGGGRVPPLPPGFGPQGIPAPREGPVGRTISRILPGGMSGREFTPYEGAELDKMGRPIAVYPDRADRLVAPPGYVIVYPWGPQEEPIAMLKGAARAMGLWKSRPKPPVSGWDMRAITRAKSAQGRVKRLANAVGLKTARKGRGS